MELYADASYDPISHRMIGAYYDPINKTGSSYELFSNYKNNVDNHIAEALNILYICEHFNEPLIIYNDNQIICNRINGKNVRNSSKALYRLCGSIKQKIGINKLNWKSENDPMMKIVDQLSKKV